MSGAAGANRRVGWIADLRTGFLRLDLSAIRRRIFLPVTWMVEMGSYVVVARAHASAIFYPGDHFAINYAYADWEPCKLVFQTSYVEAAYDAPVPKDLWVDIRGKAPDLPNAVYVFVAVATEISNIIVLGVNATMGRLEPELAFDASPEKDEYEFLQSFMPDWPLLPFPGRKIDIQAISAFEGDRARPLKKSRQDGRRACNRVESTEASARK